MCNFFQRLLEYFAALDLSGTGQGISAVWMAIIATVALGTWRGKLNAEKRLAFIDDLTDTVHEFILLMAAPVSELTVAKIGISSHKGIAQEYEQYENSEAIAFIEKAGEATAKRIQDHLRVVKPVLGKMHSLVAKGQVFGLSNHDQCQNACSMLSWSHDQIEAFCAIIRNPDLNWEHPEVQRGLELLSKIDADGIKSNLTQQNKVFLLFAKSVYTKALK